MDGNPTAQPPAGPNHTADAIRAAADGIGYVRCGFTTTAPFERFATDVARRAAAYPDVADAYRAMAGRADPRAQALWARSVVVCIRRYGKYRLPGEPIGHIGRNYLADRRIPACPDHDMPGRMTRALRNLGLRVKRGGLPDRAAAERAGVAAIGRNGFAYAADWGSWINIETWLVDVELPPGSALPTPCPPGCRACTDACPTSAIERPYTMRMDRCIAHLTYGAPEPLDPALAERMGGWVYGCDECQAACPLNHGAWQDLEPAAWLDDIARLLTPEALANLDFETWRARIQPLFWYIPDTEEGWMRWRRNAARAAACSH
jgi:epoxyqueuosine reductase